jgi:hypothetical protein
MPVQPWFSFLVGRAKALLRCTPMSQGFHVVYADVVQIDAFITPILAILAFLLSLYTLWATHLKPFRPLFLLRGPTLRFVGFIRDVGTAEKTLKVSV